MKELLRKQRKQPRIGEIRVISHVRGYKKLEMVGWTSFGMWRLLGIGIGGSVHQAAVADRDGADTLPNSADERRGVERAYPRSSVFVRAGSVEDTELSFVGETWG